MVYFQDLHFADAANVATLLFSVVLFAYWSSYHEEAIKAPPSVFHSKIEEFRQVPFPTAQQVNLLTCSPHCPSDGKRQVGKLWMQFWSHWCDPTWNQTRVCCSRSRCSTHSAIQANEHFNQLATINFLCRCCGVAFPTLLLHLQCHTVSERQSNEL